MIITANLRLVPFTQDHYNAIFSNDYVTLGELLEVVTPCSWTEFEGATEALPILYEFFQKLRGDTRWGSYFIIHAADGRLIGTGGYKGLPDHNGYMEIGYEICNDYRHRGFATETARALIEFALNQPGVKGIKAHTLAEENYSVRVLRRCGMRFRGSFVDQYDGELWRWEKLRPPVYAQTLER